MLQIVTFELCRISKIPNSTVVRTIEKKIEKKIQKFGKIQTQFEWGVVFWNFSSHSLPMFTKTDKTVMKIGKIFFFFFKNLKRVSAYGLG